MTKQYHINKLHRNPWHCEEVPHNNHDTPRRQTKQGKLPSLPHQDDCKTIMHSKERTTKHKTITEWEQQLTTNQFYWYQIFALNASVVKHRHVKLAWRLSNYCNVSSLRNNLIKLTHHDETKKKGSRFVDGQSYRKPQVEPRWAQQQTCIRHLTHRLKFDVRAINKSEA